MIRSSSLILLGVLFSLVSTAQNLEIFNIDPGTYQHDTAQYGQQQFQLLNTDCMVRNIGNNTIDVSVFKTPISVAGTSEAGMQWGSAHYVPFVDTSSALNAVTMTPGNAGDPFRLEFYVNESPGYSTYKVCFFDQNNMADSVCMIVNFDLTTVGIDEALEGLVSISDLYPNPTSNSIAFDYDMKQSHSSSAVLIYDLIGNLMETKAVEASSGKFQLDVSSYASGMYLLELRLDGKLGAREKFTVNR
jgi:hypothetical protein